MQKILTKKKMFATKPLFFLTIKKILIFLKGFPFFSTMSRRVEYIYIKKVDNSIVHIGSTKDYSKRYKQQADQTKTEFESKELLYLFECNLNEGRQIESEFKKEFGHLLATHEGNAREQYFWNSLSKEKFLHSGNVLIKSA